MEFKTPTIEDKEEIDRCILADDTRSCDYATANIILWSPFYQVKYAIIDGLFVSHTDEEGGSFCYPLGKGDKKKVLQYFMDDCKEKKIPFVTTGSTTYRKVKQVDNDQQSACRELTSILLMRQMKHIALLGGSESFVVNQNRYKGYQQAYQEAGREVEETLVYRNLESCAFMDRAVEEVLEKGADCIVCMDDAICIQVLRKLRQEHIKVPQDIRVASFYNSSVLENNIPSITSLSFNARELGMEACKNLLAQIEGETVPDRTLLSYEVVLKESTK